MQAWGGGGGDGAHGGFGGEKADPAGSTRGRTAG